MTKRNFILVFLLLTLTYCQEDIQETEEINHMAKVAASLDSANQAQAILTKKSNEGKENSTDDLRISAAANSFYLFNQGNRTQYIHKSHSNTGLSWSTNSQLGNNSSTTASPTPAYYKDKFFVFYKAESSDDILFSYSYDGNYWYKDRLLGNGAKTDKKIGACVYGGKIYVFYRTFSYLRNRLYYSYSSDGFTWIEKEIETDYEINSGPEAIYFNEKMHIFYTPRGEGSEQWVQHIKTTDFINFEETQETKLWSSEELNSSAVVFKGNLYLFTHRSSSSSSNLIRSYKSTDGINWVGNGYLDGTTSHSPSSAVLNDRLFVFYKGRTSNTIIYTYSEDAINWSQEFAAGGTTKASPSILSTLERDQSSFQANLAIHATVNASSTYDGYSASKVNDGNRNTTVGPSHSWTNNFPQGGTLPEWVLLDFSREKAFNRVDLFTSAGYEIQDYTIRYSQNGNTWYTFASVTNNTNTHNSHTVSVPVKARYLRVECLKGPSNQSIYARINEIEVLNIK